MPRRRPSRTRATRKTARYLKSVQRADGIGYKWEPGPALRAAGWPSEFLGHDLAEATRLAEAINQRLDDWRRGAQRPADVGPARPRHATFGDLCIGFRASWATRDAPLAAKTRREYERYVTALEEWAGHKTLLASITADNVEYLRDCLLGRIDGVPGKGQATAIAMLRTLSAMFTWAEQQRLLPRGSNPASKLDLPAPRMRVKRIDRDVADHLVAAADAEGLAPEALAIALAFYTIQRQGDLLAVTETGWREAFDVAEYDRPMLAGVDGRVMTLRLKQQKTAAWVSCPVPPALQARIDGAFKATRATRQPGSNAPVYLLTDAASDDRFHERTFRRRWRAIVDRAIASAKAAGDGWLVDQLTGLQFRDLRRSGACWMRNRGATIAQIAARGGWAIEYTTKILQTYMPADEAGSAAGLATALRADAQADARKERAGDKSRLAD
jgi:integrase